MNKYLKIIIISIGTILLLLLIDLICIFTINRPIFAIKEDNGDSVELIYRGIFYDVYNCHEYSMPQIKSKGAKLKCLVINFEESKESTISIETIDNVTMTISDIDIKGATITIKDQNNKPYTYSDWYKLEKNINGKWYELKTLIDNYGFNEIGYLPNENSEVTFVIDWSKLYGKLNEGNYRILKQVNTKYISVEFGIEKNTRVG